MWLSQVFTLCIEKKLYIHESQEDIVPVRSSVFTYHIFLFYSVKPSDSPTIWKEQPWPYWANRAWTKGLTTVFSREDRITTLPTPHNLWALWQIFGWSNVLLKENQLQIPTQCIQQSQVNFLSGCPRELPMPALLSIVTSDNRSTKSPGFRPQ